MGILLSTNLTILVLITLPPPKKNEQNENKYYNMLTIELRMVTTF